MERPIIKNGDTAETTEITMSLAWFARAVMAVDKHSYACGGIFTCTDGSAALSGLAVDLLQKNKEELANHRMS